MYFISILVAFAICATATAIPPPPPASIPTHLQCKSDQDCVVRNVGNCCGYYPQCANPKAKLPPPCPNGGFGVCGFPVVEACSCRGGKCLSV
ncbi:hypothetical protein NLU13_6981 [Sarocladium strictum]|uniref:Uncharacterized protein n=1 Tax=Sarocladium strictum TaxID=5046 RepID=A0AA39L6N1_SARSR|nr:hypothetical protein NLU13_6981 [Sarocladium strictum]